VKRSNDREEIQEIEKTHELMKTYNPDGQFSWVSDQTNWSRNGELNRDIADTGGIFMQVQSSHTLSFLISIYPILMTCFAGLCSLPSTKHLDSVE